MGAVVAVVALLLEPVVPDDVVGLLVASSWPSSSGAGWDGTTR